MTLKDYSNQAAVLLLLREIAGTEQLLLTRRADHLAIHAGEVAFPGGKWEAGDDSLLMTALRESHEEVGLPPQCVSLRGQLPPSYTRGRMKVTPFVGAVIGDPRLRANKDELDAFFWVPLELFMQDQRLRTDLFNAGDQEYWAPVYEFDGHTIWGFTARVIVDFMRQFYAIELGREHSAPAVKYTG